MPFLPDNQGTIGSPVVLQDDGLGNPAVPPLGVMPRTITEVNVAPSGAEFSSISAACASIIDSTPSKRYIVRVAPGDYTEAQIDVPDYVSVVGSAIQPTQVGPDAVNHHIFNLGVECEISYMTLYSAGSGYAGIACDDIGDWGQCHKVSFFDCDIGILVKSATQDTYMYAEYVDFTGDYSYGVKVESSGGFEAFCNAENVYNLPASSATYHFHVTGADAHLELLAGGSDGVTTGTGIYIAAGECKAEAMYFNNMVTGLHLTGDATVTLSSVVFENNTTGLYSDSSTLAGAHLHCAGVQLHDCATNINVDNANLAGNFTGYTEHDKTIINTSSSFFLTNRDAQRIIVAKVGGDYSSVKSAIDSITDASSARPYIVSVGPGIYTESPFSMKNYVSIVGDSLYSTFIQTNDDSAHFITAKGNAQIYNATILGPANSGYAAIYNTDTTGIFSTVLVRIQKGYYGIWAAQAGASAAITYCVNTTFEYTGTYCENFVRATAYGRVAVAVSAVSAAVANTIGYGYFVSGANASMIVGSAEFAGVASGAGDKKPAAFGCDDGALLRLAACSASYGEVGIHIGATGTGSRVQASGVELTRGTFTGNHIQIDVANASMRFSGSADKSKIAVTAGSSLAASFADETTGEEGMVIRGELWVGDTGGTPLASAARDTFSTGWVSGGAVTRDTGLDVDVAAGVGYINDGVHARRIAWSADNISLPANSTSWIYVDDTGTVLSQTSDVDHELYIELAVAVTNGSSVVLLTTHVIPIPQADLVRHQYLKNAIGPIAVSGCVASKSGTAKRINVDSGTFYVADNEFQPAATAPITFAYWYRGAGTDWIKVSGATVVDVDYYNAPAATQVVASGGRTLTFADADPDTITASSGDFAADGFQPGMTLVVAGTSSNNGTYTIDTVATLVLTLVPGDTLVNEGPLSATATLDAYGLAEIPAGKWKKDLLFVAVGAVITEYHIVYAQEYFDTQNEAEVGNDPTPPGELDVYALKCAGSVVQQGDTVITTIVDARPSIGSQASGSTSVTDHGGLTGLADDDHTQYQLRSEKNAANGYPGLSAGSLIAAAQLPAATTTVKGAVELATDGEVAANVVVQGNDSRLSDARAPTGSASGDLAGTYPGPEVKQASKTFAFTGIISPASIGSNQDDYNPDPTVIAVRLRLTSSGDYSISGLVGGSAGRVMLIHNIGSFTLTILHESGASSPANRFLVSGGVSVAIPPGGNITVCYDAISSRWRVSGHPMLHAPTHLPSGSDPITTAAATANPPGTVNAEGTAESLARSDHKHALAAFGTSAGTFCEGNDSRLTRLRATYFTEVTVDTTTTTTTWPASTTIAAGSDGQTLPQATINVVSTVGFAASGSIRVWTTTGMQTVTYTGTTGTSFTGCTGGTGVMNTGNAVWAITVQDILASLITTGASAILIINFTASISNATNNVPVYARLVIDGVVRRGVEFRSAANEAASGAITYRLSGLGAIQHSVVVQWRVSGGTGQIRPVAAPDQSHAGMTIMEVSV